MSDLTYEQLVEKVSKAICMVNCHNPDAVLADNLDHSKWEIYVPDARAAIATIAEAIKDPTEEILDAYWHRSGESSEMRSRVHDRARCYYAGMRLASPLNPEGK